jgi:hypothetical protein
VTDWWDKKAGDLQGMASHDYPTEDATREDFYRLLLHTRQDIILIVSYLSSLNRQAFQIKLLLGAVVALLAYSIYRH